MEWVPIGELPAADSLAFDHGESLRLYPASRGKSSLIPIVASAEHFLRLARRRA